MQRVLAPLFHVLTCQQTRLKPGNLVMLFGGTQACFKHLLWFGDNRGLAFNDEAAEPKHATIQSSLQCHQVIAVSCFHCRGREPV